MGDKNTWNMPMGVCAFCNQPFGNCKCRPSLTEKARVEVPTMADEREIKPFDMHCPLMGKGLNFWKSQCEIKQKNPDLKLTCYPKCKAVEVKTRTENTVKHNPHNGTTKKVIALAKSGMATGDIATKLDIEPGTVSRYKWLAKKRGLL